MPTPQRPDCQGPKGRVPSFTSGLALASLGLLAALVIAVVVSLRPASPPPGGPAADPVHDVTPVLEEPASVALAPDAARNAPALADEAGPPPGSARSRAAGARGTRRD